MFNNTIPDYNKNIKVIAEKQKHSVTRSEKHLQCQEPQQILRNEQKGKRSESMPELQSKSLAVRLPGCFFKYLSSWRLLRISSPSGAKKLTSFLFGVPDFFVNN
jgi:hypothetical protein